VRSYRFVTGLVSAGLLAVCSMPGSAAGFVNNGKAWLALPPDGKAAYAQGLNDSVNFIYVNDDLATAIVKLARTRCLVEQKMTAAVVADRITTAYTKEPNLINQPPLFIYVAKMGMVCREFINQERARYSLPPVQ
jgi:hypothetical protein